MQLLEERINKDGIVKEGNVLKVDSFLNHQMDIELYNEIGKEFRRLFPDKSINKILTIEASGIGIACVTAQYFGCGNRSRRFPRNGPRPYGTIGTVRRHHRLHGDPAVRCS